MELLAVCLCTTLLFTFSPTDEDVSKKIKNLRTQFMRERTKTRKSKSGEGAETVYITKWPHFQRLRFLEEFIIPKKSISNITVS